MNKKILVTGGTGYIGSHTVVELLSKGYECVIVDNLINSNRSVIKSIKKITGKDVKFYSLNCRNFEYIDDLFHKNKFDAVIHFAALKSVEESIKKPSEYYRNNIDSLLTILNICEFRKVNNFLFSSSCIVYGQPDYVPVDELAQFKPAKSPYGNTKKIAEEILSDICKSNPSMNVISLRYFNPVGAHPSGLIGEYPIGTPNNLMPVITQHAIGKLTGKIKINGNNYNTNDGTCIRDYIHIIDLAKAHVAALERLFSDEVKTENRKTNYEAYNVGTGSGISVLEMILIFQHITGVKLDYEFGPRREGDIEKIYADTRLANEKLKWKTELGLARMIEDAWRWEQNIKDKL